MKLAERAMTEAQQQILQYILFTQASGEPRTYSWYVKTLSRDLNLPESTVKWSLNNLRNACLIESGTANRRGIPLRLTYPGALVAGRISKKDR
ncbi:MAG: hypothetical protein QFX35_02705 [Candidatus Verstraetearchaeota archaeon]|nr:hypothetical protein [Candidatus Verstraetearchaeota archaeon]